MKKPMSMRAVFCLMVLVFGALGAWAVEKTGEKPEYDHFLFRYTGTVFPLDATKEQAYAHAVSDACGTETASTTCWQRAISSTFKEKGGEEAFGVAAYLSNTQSSFQENCGPSLYELGQDAYRTFKSGQQVYATIRTKYCGYSFFSGVLDSLMADKGDAGTVDQFCTAFDAALTPQEKLFSSCLHGFGEAIVLSRAQQPFSSPEDLIHPGIAACQKITTTSADQEECAGGAFNALATLYKRNTPGLAFDTADPLRICNEENALALERPCYRMFKYLLMEAGGGDFVRASAFIELAQDDKVAAAGIYDLASLLSRSPESNSLFAEECEKLQPRVQNSCVQGIAAGLMVHGTLGQEYRRALAFCGLSALSTTQRDSCYTQTLWMSATRYSAPTTKEICAQVPEPYRKTYTLCA